MRRANLKIAIVAAVTVFTSVMVLGSFAPGSTPTPGAPAPSPSAEGMVIDCRMDDTCEGDFKITIIGGLPTDPMDRCFLAMDLFDLATELCEPIKENLG